MADTSKEGRLRQIAKEKNDFGDHGHDSKAGVPHAQSGGTYRGQPPLVTGGGSDGEKTPFKIKGGGK